MSKRRKIQGWLIQKKPVQGGNSTVYLASRSDDADVALKVMSNDNGNPNRYERFRDEVKILQELNGHPGIIPYIDSSLPEIPTRNDPAWLAMSIGIPILERLEKSDPIEIIEAVHLISVTLAELHGKNIFHRDLKPDNLFFFQDHFRLGDFGLTTFPGKSNLTKKHQRVGSMFYMPDEMMDGGDNPEGGPADVFSLAKVLWVLITKLERPPWGHLAAGSANTGLIKWGAKFRNLYVVKTFWTEGSLI